MAVQPSRPNQFGMTAYYWMLAIGFLDLFTPLLPVPNAFCEKLFTIAITSLYMASVVGFALAIARMRLSVLSTLGVIWLSGVAWFIEYDYMDPKIMLAGHRFERLGGEPTPLQMVAFSYPPALASLALIGAAVGIGALVARIIKHPNLIGPIGVLVALVDTWGVLFGGIVSKLLTSPVTAGLAKHAMASGPHSFAIGPPPAYSVDVPDVGIGDFLFISLLLTVLVNLNMNWKGAAWVMGGLSTMALCLIALRVQIPVPHHGTFKMMPIPALPGLVFIGGGAVLTNLKSFQFTREEKFALLYAGAFVIVLSAVLYLGFSYTLHSAAAITH